MPDHRFPYGDAFIIGTPHIDALSNQLYQEQRQRELYQQQQQKALDDEFSKELIGVRRIDIPEVAKSYNDFKQTNIGVRELGNKATPEDHFKVVQAKANMYQTINGSKQQKELEQNVGKGIMSKPLDFEDDAHNTLMKSMNTPLSQLGELATHDYANKGTNTDFGKMMKDAAGTEGKEPSYVEKTPMDKNGEQTMVTPYYYHNNPMKIHDYIIGALSKAGAGRDAERIVSNLDPVAIQQTQLAFNQAPISKWQKLGLDKPQDLNITPYDSKAEIFAKHTAQLDFLSNEPRVGKPSTIDNKVIAREANFKNALYKQKLGADYAMDRVMAYFNVKRTADNKDDFAGLSNILNNTRDMLNSGVPEKGTMGEDHPDRLVISDYNILKAFSNIKGYNPSRVIFDKGKDQFEVQYDGKIMTDNDGNEVKDKDGNVKTLPAETIPLSKRDYLRLKVDEMNPKNKGKTNANIDKILTEKGSLSDALEKVFSPDVINQQNTKITTSETKTFPAFSRDQFKSKGWTDEQINKAVKAGKISIK